MTREVAREHDPKSCGLGSRVVTNSSSLDFYPTLCDHKVSTLIGKQFV